MGLEISIFIKCCHPRKLSENSIPEIHVRLYNIWLKVKGVYSIKLTVVVFYLNERLCGQMGVTMTAGTLGWIMLAPAATA